MERQLTRRHLLGGLLGGLVMPLTQRISPVLAAPSYRPVKGISVYYQGDNPTDQQAIADQINRFKQMGITGISLVFPVFMDTWDGTLIQGRAGKTPTDDQFDYFLHTAQAAGITHLMMRPLLDEGSIDTTGAPNPSTFWRGQILPGGTDPSVDPTGAQAWFDSYTSLLGWFATVAQRNKVNWLCLGTELNSLEEQSYEPFWFQLINSVRQNAGPGVKLTYAANFWNPQAEVKPPRTWLKKLDGLCLDDYSDFPGCDDNSTAEQIYQAYQTHQLLLDTYRDPKRPFFITEAGVASQDGVLAHPWSQYPDGGANPTPNMQVQARVIQAGCKYYFDQNKVDGVFWWDAGIYLQTDPIHDTSWEIMGKPAQKTLANYYHSH